jgi:hypothetical protein
MAAYAVRNGAWSPSTRSGPHRQPLADAQLDAASRRDRAGARRDPVLFTGDPFSPASRVKYVIVDGKIVYEAP